MDLVGADEYMVLHADISHPLQFFAGEYTAGRVLRIAKDKEFCVGIGGISLKIFKVDLVMIGFQGEGTSMMMRPLAVTALYIGSRSG